MALIEWLRPSRSVPITRWRCDGRWRPRPGALVVLIAGLYLFGTGEALMVVAGIGVSPWTVLAQGLSLRLDVSIGLATFAVSVVVLLLWIPLRERPGVGTVANAMVIALALQVGVTVLPGATHPVAQILLALAGIALVGIGSGFYLTTNLGPGPRDGWMTGVHERTGWPVSVVRLAIEVTVLSIGWLLGGTVGVGTLMFAVLIGPAVGYGLLLAGRLGRPVGAPASRINDDEFPELEA